MSAFLQFWWNAVHCKSAYKTDSTVICVKCMLELVCFEPFPLTGLQIWKICYVNWLKFEFLSEIHASKTRFKQINENLRPKIYACMFWKPLTEFYTINFINN